MERRNLLDHELELRELLTADSTTISIANTKNGTKGAIVHHDAIGGAICPVAALARRIANLHGMDLKCSLSMVCHPATRATQTDASLWRYGGEQRLTACWIRVTPLTACHLTAFGLEVRWL
jgi:hypothetical protein